MTSYDTGRKPAHSSSLKTEAGCYFLVLERAFEAACRRQGGPLSRDYNIGGLPVRLHFAGPRLESLLTPALAHLREDFEAGVSDQALVLSAWDSGPDMNEMPAPAWRWEDCQAHGEIRGFNDPRFRTVFDGGSHVLCMHDTLAGRGFFWTRDSASLPYWECAAPLRTFFHWALSPSGLQLTHGAAVGFSNGGVLLAGRGGSGKSTSALACLNSPLLYAGDDYCLTSSSPRPFVHSLYNTAKVSVESIGRLPHLAPYVSNPNRLDEEKAVLFISKHFPGKVTRGFPLRAILIPRIANTRDTHLRAITQAEGLKALAPSTVFQLAGDGGGTWRKLAALARQLPCYVLEAGADLAQIPRVISRFLIGHSE